MKEIREIIILFKTHLDVGYTDFAENVIKSYMESYIPNALKVAGQMRGEKERFIWTTGSWLISRFLEESPQRTEMEDAIRNGDIRWHGLPFTTHTELMDRELFQYGLSLSQKLDERFGRKTIAAKMTDVPGHTRAMVPELAKAGIKFLHLGVNPASSVPAVPPLFRWKAPDGQEIVVMYNGDYGEFTEIGDTGAALYFAHTGDNRGPQSAEEIRRLYKDIHQKYPEAVLRAGTLEDVAQIALSIQDLPVITGEIGDSWIYGTGSDPGKISQYRALLRRRLLLKPEERDEVDKSLLLIPEHTWGLCYERFLGWQLEDGSFIGEHNYYERSEFEKMRPTEKFRIMETSWQEQRNYLSSALKAFPESERETAAAEMREYRRTETDLAGFAGVPREPDTGRYHAEMEGWRVTAGENGSVVGLERNGCIYADEAHPLGEFLYEVFSPEDYRRFEDSYVTVRYDWALEEFGKIGMEKAVDRHLSAEPRVTGVWKKDSHLLIQMGMEGEAAERFGAPARLELLMTFSPKDIIFDLAWFRKSASRVAEGLCLRFCPPQKLTGSHKMGEWFRPDDMVPKGGRRLHAVEDGVRFEACAIRPVDCALVSLGGPSLLTFDDREIPVSDGVSFHLFNNVWNTNFPMWYDEDARFRFVFALRG